MTTRIEADLFDPKPLVEAAKKALGSEWHAGHLIDDEHPCNCDCIVNESYAGGIATVHADNGLRISDGGNDAPPLEVAKAHMRHIVAAQPSAILAWAARDAGLVAEVERLRAVVRGFVSWANNKCPCRNDEPNPCPLCGASVENLEPCKAADNTFPRQLLQDAQTALGSRTDG